MKNLFQSVLAILDNKIHPMPDKEEAEKVKAILTKGQGYLTKDKPVRIIFFDEI